MSEAQAPSGYRYTVFYGGGIGPYAWDAERVVYAVDIKDALAQCGDITDDGAWIISVEQIDYPQPTAREQLANADQRSAHFCKLATERWLDLEALRARLAELEGIAEQLIDDIDLLRSHNLLSGLGRRAYEAYTKEKR